MPKVKRLAPGASTIVDLGTVRFPTAHDPSPDVDLHSPAVRQELDALAGADAVVTATESGPGRTRSRPTGRPGIHLARTWRRWPVRVRGRPRRLAAVRRQPIPPPECPGIRLVARPRGGPGGGPGRAAGPAPGGRSGRRDLPDRLERPPQNGAGGVDPRPERRIGTGPGRGRSRSPMPPAPADGSRLLWQRPARRSHPGRGRRAPAATTQPDSGRRRTGRSGQEHRPPPHGPGILGRRAGAYPLRRLSGSASGARRRVHELAGSAPARTSD